MRAKLPAMLLPSTVVPRPGLVVSASARVRPGAYLLPGGEAKPALTVRGDGIVVDFTGVVLRGTPATAMPDVRQGIGVLVEGSDVTIKGLRVHGYKVALMAKGVKGLRLLDCDLSYNWKQRLRSTVEKEDEADWMSFHHNEEGEWLRYGAGAYLDGCEGFEVRGLRVTGGQCGLMLNRSNRGLVWNCDLSYNSGVGLGMYHSSDDRVMHNRMDYDVRGFSHGVYNRGQDSAGILVFEGCMRNAFAYNSVTHGGDGFFLWAGQSTLDTGQGGCNDNLVYANDFSHAVTNGIEATFSRNAFVGNRVHGAFHGLWGGYSYDTKVVGNDFRGNQRGVAIEHGQANEIAFNAFDGDDVALALWADPPDPSFAYAKARDVRSRDSRIVGNLFRDVPLALDLRGTTNTLLSENVFDTGGRLARLAGEPFSPLPVTNTVSGLVLSSAGLPGTQERVEIRRGAVVWNPLRLPESARPFRVAPLKGGLMPFLARSAPQGWSTILVDEWGPYDSRRPLLWPERTSGAAPLPGGTSAGSGAREVGTLKGTGRYRVLGPKGRWRLVSAEGAALGATSGPVPGTVAIRVPPGRIGTTKVELEYVGGAITDVRGIVTPAGRPVRFGFSRFDAPIAWTAAFYRWTESVDPSNPHAAPKGSPFLGAPFRTLRADRLDLVGASLAPGLPADHYATRADGSFELPEGDYTVEVTTDDGARLSLDGTLLVDEWRYQGPTTYRKDVHLAKGRHTFHVEHFQIDGYATLRVTIRPRGNAATMER